MKVGCQNCNFVGDINDNSIKERGLMLTCPKCKKTIYINKSGHTTICHNCGFENLPEEVFCRSCKTNLKKPKSFLGDKDVSKLHKIAVSEMKSKKEGTSSIILRKKNKELNQKLKAIEIFKTLFYEAISDGVLTDFEIKYLKLFTQKNNIVWKDALALVSKEANSFINSILKTYIEDGILKEDEKKKANRIGQILNINVEKKIKIFENLDTTKRRAVELFKEKFKEFISDGVLTVQEIKALKKFANKYDLNWDDMMTLVRSDALDLVQSLVKTASEDNVIDKREEKIINKAMDVLKLGEDEREIINYDLLAVKAKALDIFRDVFIEAIDDSELDENEIIELKQTAEKYGLSWEGSVKYVVEHAKDFIRQLLMFAKQDGILSKEEEKTIKKMGKLLEIPEYFKREIYNEMKLVKKLQNIREGNLPFLNLKPAPVIVESNELFHIYDPCIYIKTDRKHTKTKGKLVLTNNRVFFLGKYRSFKFPYKSIFKLSYDSSSVFIDRQGQGRGFYEITNPEIVYEVFLCLTKKSNFLITQSDQVMSRHISQEVKVEVYQRDGGRCVMCGDKQYLEFDHIIPFSKGGANTVDNIQILCKSCNMQKGVNI